MDSGPFFLWDKVTAIALGWPAVYEKLCFGTPALYVEKKFFVRLKEDNHTVVVYHHDRDELIASNPDVFFTTDHYKNYPSVLIDLERVCKNELKALLANAWRIRASKKLLEQDKDHLP